MEFTLFIHSVYELLQAHPEKFQFNENFLIFVLDTIYVLVEALTNNQKSESSQSQNVDLADDGDDEEDLGAVPLGELSEDAEDQLSDSQKRNFVSKETQRAMEYLACSILDKKSDFENKQFDSNNSVKLSPSDWFISQRGSLWLKYVRGFFAGFFLRGLFAYFL